MFLIVFQHSIIIGTGSGANNIRSLRSGLDSEAPPPKMASGESQCALPPLQCFFRTSSITGHDMLVAPILCTSVQQLSRRRERERWGRNEKLLVSKMDLPKRTPHADK